MSDHFLVFALDGQRCALPLARVERVLRAVEITALPGAKLPMQVRGVVNVHGTVMPVFDLRPVRRHEEVRESEQMILVALGTQRQALILCDDVEGVRQVNSEDIASSREMLPETLAGRGDVLNIEGELIYVSDLDALMEGDAWQQWQAALAASSDGKADKEIISH